MTETKDKVDVLILDDNHVTSEVCATTGNGKPVVMVFIRELGYRKVCARWLLKTQKAQNNICAELLQHVEKDNQWNGIIKSLSLKKKLKVQVSPGKVMGSIFWGCKGILLVEFLQVGCHSQFRVICADIKEVKATNLKGSAK